MTNVVLEAVCGYYYRVQYAGDKKAFYLETFLYIV